jgi:hypothetical protein
VTTLAYRLFVNAERTVLVRLWNTGEAEVCTRESDAHIWGPPLLVQEEERE